MVKKIFVKKIFWSKKIFQRKKIWSNKIPGQKKFWLKKFLLMKKILFKKIFWLRKSFGPKCFRFLSKKSGRVNPGAGIYDPTPQENSRVKIVWNCC